MHHHNTPSTSTAHSPEAQAHSAEASPSIWQQLAAPLPVHLIAWRQDGKPIERHGQYFARHVCYIEANTVRERLDCVAAGEWDLTLDLLPSTPGTEDNETAYAFKARLQVCGVIREDIGAGCDYKQAATDAFKRAAVRFGIGHELYAYEQNWVEMESNAKAAKPLEDPQQAYERRHGHHVQSLPVATIGTDEACTASGAVEIADIPRCPKCGGRTWDNRLTKRNPKAPDYKCRNRHCDGVIWPPKSGEAADETRLTEIAA